MNTGWKLLPPLPDVCQECAVNHAKEQPHDQQSLYYQYHFYSNHGLWPTWADAMSHCTPEIQKMWREALEKRGIRVDGWEKGDGLHERRI